MSQNQPAGLPAEPWPLPKQRKHGLEDARKICAATDRFCQLRSIADRQGEQGWKRARKAAARPGVKVQESRWRELTG